MLEIVRAPRGWGLLDGARLRYVERGVTYGAAASRSCRREWHSYWDAPPVVALRLSAFVHRHFVDRGAPVPGNRTVAILKAAAGARQANNPSARRSTFRNATIHYVAAEDLVSHSHHHHREGPPDVTIKWVFKKSGEAIETPAYFGENLLRLARHDIPSRAPARSLKVDERFDGAVIMLPEATRNFSFGVRPQRA
ncbi:hypothetical protein JL722_15289 [Aureococcus anophagefferens]|nr:hypothetical protein JL722_15289 [Aureococcus anophagefferens]